MLHEQATYKVRDMLLQPRSRTNRLRAIFKLLVYLPLLFLRHALRSSMDTDNRTGCEVAWGLALPELSSTRCHFRWICTPQATSSPLFYSVQEIDAEG